MELSGTLHRRLAEGRLDLVLGKRGSGETHGRLVWRDRLVWIGGERLRLDPERPVPLIVYPPPSITRGPGARRAGAGRARMAHRLHQRQPERGAARRHWPASG